MVQRIVNNVRDPRTVHRLLEKVERGTSLSNEEAALIYRGVDVEAGPGILKKIFIGPHAQYRMDQRGVTVSHLRKSLSNFLKDWDHEHARDSMKAEAWDDLADGEVFRWDDPRMGMSIVMKIHEDGSTFIVTDYFTSGDPRPPSLEHCNIRLAAVEDLSCSGTRTSTAWIDPKGEVHSLEGTHIAWAFDWVLSSQKNRLLYEKMKDVRPLNPEGLLLELGWIRVTNSLSFEALTSNSRAWKSAVEFAIRCAVSERRDPFKNVVFVNNRKLTLDKFVKEYGGREQEDALYSQLASRVASRYALKETVMPGVQTLVETTEPSTDVEDNDLQDPGLASPGSTGRDIGKFEFNTPDSSSDIKPRTVGTPGGEVPVNDNTSGFSRRTMTSSEGLLASVVNVAALYLYSAENRGFKPPQRPGGTDLKKQREQTPQKKRQDRREYQSEKSQRQHDALVWYHKRCKPSRRCRQRKEEYRADPEKYERRSPDYTKEASAEVQRVAKTSPSICRSGVSVAWIDPSGKVVSLPGGLTHGEWALKRQMKKGLYEDAYSFDDEEADEQRDQATDDLLNEGWVRVSNWRDLEGWKLTPKSSEKMVELVLDCFLDEASDASDLELGGEARVDPEQFKIFFAKKKDTVTPISLPDFVEKYGGRGATDRLYESLLAKVASEGETNQDGPNLYQQGNPTDSQTHYQGELNDNPNNLAMPPGNPIMDKGREHMDPGSTKVIPEGMKQDLRETVTYQASVSRVSRIFASSTAARLRRYGYGECHLFTLALLRLLPGSRPLALFDGPVVEDDDDIPIHSAVEFQGSVIDAFGVGSRDSKARKFEVRAPRWQVVAPRFIDAISDGDRDEAFWAARELLGELGLGSLKTAYDMQLCNPFQTSAAWIDPSGKVFRMERGETHSEWAEKNFPSGGRDSAIVTLLSKGWLRVANFVSFEGVRATGAALEKMAELIVDCCLDRKVTDLDQDLYYNDRRFTIEEFLDKYGTRKDQDRLYSGLAEIKSMGRGRGRVEALAEDIVGRMASLTVSTDKYEKALTEYTKDLADWSGDVSEADVASQLERTLSITKKKAAEFAKVVARAVSKARNWQGSSIRISVDAPNMRDLDNPFEGYDVFEVSVGGVDFTAWMDGSSVHVDDVIEAGDTDFFRDENVAFDYFSLVSELRDPGSSRGKVLKLWTARPVRDRELYESARSLPANIFLTNDPDRAFGLARDMGDRDVWEVLVDSSNLIETLSAGRVRDYQVVGGLAPLKSISLVSRGKTAARISEILSNTNSGILEKGAAIPVKQKMFNPDRGFFIFTVTGSKGEIYTVRLKAAAKGSAKEITKLPVRVSCSCPFFRWQGPEHWAVQNDYLWGKPKGSATKPVVKDPASDHWVCKHVVAVMNHAKSNRYRISSWTLDGPVERDELSAYLDRFFTKYRSLAKVRGSIRFREKTGISGEASQFGDEIFVSPKFWKLSPDVQDFVLAHEIGHWVLFDYGLRKFISEANKRGVDPWDTSTLPFAQGNIDEAFADCFASLHTDGDVLRRYPVWADLVRTVSSGRVATGIVG